MIKLVRRVEEIDRELIERELGVAVVIHDDGSHDSMYDLRIGDPRNPQFAIECIRATDQELRGVFGALQRKGELSVGFRNHWFVELGAQVNVKRLYSALPGLLADMETHGLNSTRLIYRFSETFLVEQLDALGVGFAYSRPPKKGAIVTFLPPGGGGAVDEYGESVASWIEAFLFARENADVIRKLEIAPAERKEVFIRTDYYGVPWSVLGYLTDDLNHLPASSPKLPLGITGVWLVCGDRGVRWDGESWRLVGKSRAKS